MNRGDGEEFSVPEVVMGLLNQDRWFDQLSEPEKKAIEEERRRLPPLGNRLIPESHGHNITQHLEAAKKRFLECRDPFCLIRVSDCELGFLGAGYMASNRLKDLAWHMHCAGFNRGAIAFRQDFIQGVREAALVGLQQNWLPVLEDTLVLFSLLGLPIPHPRGVEVHLPYKLLSDGTFVNYLVGKKVLLIGLLAKELAQLFRTKSFLDSYQMFGPVDKVRIVGMIDTRAKTNGGAWQDFRRVLDETKKFDYDVALLSCGVTAKPLAWNLWKRGKTALDVGFVFDALCGRKEREARPVFRDVKWPKSG